MPTNFEFSDDLDALISAPAREAAPAAIEPERFTCAKCRGTGKVTFGYVNIRTGDCFACSGRGFHKQAPAVRLAANAKRKETVYTNLAKHRAEFEAAHPALNAALNQMAGWSEFARSMVVAVEKYGYLTEKQLAAAYSAMAKAAARDEARAAEKAAPKAGSGKVEISAISALFAKAVDNDIKRPVFRAEGIEISKASDRGSNAGALYVKGNDGVYYGKIVGGAEFIPSREAPAGTLGLLQAVAADPTAEAIKYARRTGRCSCCGKTLVAPISIRAGIGPICAEKWGLDFRRELAADELANEAAIEAAAKAAGE